MMMLSINRNAGMRGNSGGRVSPRGSWNLGAECGMRNAECGMRNAECGMRNAECGKRDAESGMRSAECDAPRSQRSNNNPTTEDESNRRIESLSMQQQRHVTDGQL